MTRVPLNRSSMSLFWAYYAFSRPFSLRAYSISVHFLFSALRGYILNLCMDIIYETFKHFKTGQ